MITSLIVVCTYGRPDEVRELGTLLCRIRGGRGVLVVDSSPDVATLAVCRDFAFVEYLRSDRASTAYQRNRGIDRARERGVDVVHFVDDDSRPSGTYFDALDAFLNTTGAAGAGGVIVNQPPVRSSWLTRLFLLDGPRPGVVLASGRATVGHGPGSGGDVEWLPGSAMSYRLAAVDGHRFDERLDGYSWGEDLDFSYRLGREQRLSICPAARTCHDRSPIHRASARRGARDRVPILHRWVAENRRHGLRPTAFWWSVAGEVVLRGVGGALADPAARRRHWDVLRGVLQGVVDVLRGPVEP